MSSCTDAPFAVTLAAEASLWLFVIGFAIGITWLAAFAWRNRP